MEFSTTRSKLRLCDAPWHDVRLPDELPDEPHIDLRAGNSEPTSTRQPNDIAADKEAEAKRVSGDPSYDADFVADFTVVPCPPGLNQLGKHTYLSKELSKEVDSFQGDLDCDI